ncbi:hypothetical protein [Sphingomonas morindae]|uniref:Uncharacterized protein n=1 Tax=Sphingomonas morindae TaxID=1541170 RepID=A0ABY4XAN1_9SPHN|nr:hypothetical protein [Sphingomonas morindae]USI73935.1 hypothetical protein LHA26_05570 [Sphingomonas morindae]
MFPPISITADEQYEVTDDQGSAPRLDHRWLTFSQLLIHIYIWARSG